MTDEEKAAAKKKADEEAAAAEEEKKKRAAKKKIELTEDELQSRIDAATAAAVKSAADAQAKRDEKAKADAEEAEAQKRGEWEKLAEKAEEKRVAAEAERDNLKRDTRRRDVKDAIGDYLRDTHKDYAASGVERYILPQVEFDLNTTSEDITKRVKAAADQYVKDNPRSAKAPPGPPPPAPRTGNRPANQQHVQRGSEAARRF